MRGFIIVMILVLSACKKPGPTVKVYMSRPDISAIVRAQSNETLPYASTAGYFCMNPSDTEALLNYCFNPSDKPTTARLIHKKIGDETALVSKK